MNYELLAHALNKEIDELKDQIEYMEHNLLEKELLLAKAEEKISELTQKTSSLGVVIPELCECGSQLTHIREDGIEYCSVCGFQKQ